ncbi:MAG: corrinoid protein [Anaerolineae bacterium]
MSDTLATISAAVMAGEIAEAAQLAQTALGEGFDAKEVLDHSLVPSMNTVGQRFKEGDMFVPDVLFSARAMQAALDVLRPQLVASGVEMAGKVVIGTVEGDLHDIGKNLVAMMLTGAGFEVRDLGNDVPPSAFVAAVRETGAEMVGMSALLTTTMPVMGRVIKALQEAKLRKQVRIMVGGAPVTADFAREIGADGYSSNATGAAELARQWMAG